MIRILKFPNEFPAVLLITYLSFLDDFIWSQLICIEFDATEMRRLNWACTFAKACGEPNAPVILLEFCADSELYRK